MVLCDEFFVVLVDVVESDERNVVEPDGRRLAVRHIDLFNTVQRKYVGLEQGGKKRAELKAASMEYVKSKYGIEVNDDTADAICIGGAVLNMYGEK